MNLSHKLIQNVQTVILGKPEPVRLAVVCFLSGGHLLVDDIPGVGKTTLALALARSIGCRFQRIQFTSDLLPSDVLGVSIYNPKNQNFDFKPGPIFNHVVLADEVNRASPKTQSALLESMQEQQVSMDNETHKLPSPFFVIATQNPHEHHGTFPLPESQLDRFLMRIRLGYPDASAEAAILRDDAISARGDDVKLIANADEVRAEIDRIRTIFVDPSLDRYMVEIATATRNSSLIDLGLSPRGTIALRRAAQAMATTEERDYVLPDDVKRVAVAVMAHRLKIKGAHYNGRTAQTTETVLEGILNSIPVPV
jgi:MoxR-like ATPase